MAEVKRSPLTNALSNAESTQVRVQGPSTPVQRLADTRDQALSTFGNLTNAFGLPQRMASAIPQGPLQWLIPAQKAAIDARQRLTKRGLSYDQKLIDNVNIPDALESVNPMISAPVHYVGKILQNLDNEHEMNLTVTRSQAEQQVGQLPVDIATMSGAGKVAGMVGKSALSAGLGKAAANDALMSFIGKNIPKIEAAGRLGRNAVEGAAISGAHAATKEDATLGDTALSAGVGAVVGPIVGHIADRVTGRALTSRPMKWTPTPRTPIASPGAPVSPVERPQMRIEGPKPQLALPAPGKGQPRIPKGPADKPAYVAGAAQTNVEQLVRTIGKRKGGSLSYNDIRPFLEEATNWGYQSKAKQPRLSTAEANALEFAFDGSSGMNKRVPVQKLVEKIRSELAISNPRVGPILKQVADYGEGTTPVAYKSHQRYINYANTRALGQTEFETHPTDPAYIELGYFKRANVLEFGGPHVPPNEWGPRGMFESEDGMGPLDDEPDPFELQMLPTEMLFGHNRGFLLNLPEGLTYNGVELQSYFGQHPGEAPIAMDKNWPKENLYALISAMKHFGVKYFRLPTSATSAFVQGHKPTDAMSRVNARYDSTFKPLMEALGPVLKVPHMNEVGTSVRFDVDENRMVREPYPALSMWELELDNINDSLLPKLSSAVLGAFALLIGAALGEKDAEAGVADEMIVPIIVKALKKGTQKMAMSSGSISMPVDALIKDLLIHVSKDELKLLEIDGVQADKFVDAQYLTPQQDAEIRTALGAEKNTQFKKQVKDLTSAELLQVSAEEVTKKNHLEAVKGTQMDGTADIEIDPKQMVKAYQQKVGHLKKEYGKNLTLADVARVTGQPLERLQGNEVGAGGIGGSSFKPLLAQFKEQLMALDKTKGSAVAATLTETARIKKVSTNAVNPVVDAVLQQAGTSVKEFAQIIGLSKKDTMQVYAYDPNILSQALQPGGTYGEELRMIKGKYAVIQHILEDKRPEDSAWVQFADKYNKLTPYEAVKTFESSGDLDTPLYANLYDDDVHTVMGAANPDALEFAMSSVVGEDMVGHSSRSRYIDLENMEAISTPEGPQVLEAALEYNADIEHISSGRVVTIKAVTGAQLAAMEAIGSVKISNIVSLSSLDAADQAASRAANDELMSTLGANGANIGPAWTKFVKKVQPLLRKKNKQLANMLDNFKPTKTFYNVLLATDFLTRKVVKYPQLHPVVRALIERVDKVAKATNQARVMLNYGDDFEKFSSKYPHQAAQYEEVLRVFSIQKSVEPHERANKILQISNSLSPAGQQLFATVQAQITGMQRDLQARGATAIKTHASYDKILNATVKQAIDNFIQGKFFFNEEYVTFDRSGRYQVVIKSKDGRTIWHSGHEDRGEATKILQTFERSMPDGLEGSLRDQTQPGRILKRPVGGRIRTEFKPVGAGAESDVAMDAFAPTAPKDNVAQWNTELMSTVENILAGQTPQFDQRLNTRSLVPGYKVNLKTIYKNFIAQATALADMEARASLRNSKPQLLKGIALHTPARQPVLSKALQNDSELMIDQMVNEPLHNDPSMLGDIKAILAIRSFGLNLKFCAMQVAQEIAMIGQVATRWSTSGMRAFATAEKDLANSLRLLMPQADDSKNMAKLVNSLKGLSLFEKQTMHHLIEAGQMSAKFIDAFVDSPQGKVKILTDGTMYLARRAELHNRLISALTFIRIGESIGYNTTEQLMPFVKTWMNIAAPSNEKFWLPRMINHGNSTNRELMELMYLFQRFNVEQTNRTLEAFEQLHESGIKAILGLRSPRRTGASSGALPVAYWFIATAINGGTAAVTNPLLLMSLAGGLVGGTGFLGVAAARKLAEANSVGREPKSVDDILKAIDAFEGSRVIPANYRAAHAAMLEQSVGASPDLGGAKGLLYDTAMYGLLAGSGFNMQRELGPEGYLGTINVLDWYERAVDTSATSDGIIDAAEKQTGVLGKIIGGSVRLAQGEDLSYMKQGQRIGVPNIPMWKSILATVTQLTPNEVTRRQDTLSAAGGAELIRDRLYERLADDYRQSIEAGIFDADPREYKNSLLLWNDAIKSRFAINPKLRDKFLFSKTSMDSFDARLKAIRDAHTYNPDNSLEGAIDQARQTKKSPSRKNMTADYYETGQSY